MNLRHIENGTKVLIDSNIFIYWLTGRSTESGEFLRRCAEGMVEGYISILCLAEIAHRLMILEARENRWVGISNPVRSLQAKPERVQALLRYEEQIRDILRLRLKVENLTQRDLLESFVFGKQYGLLTNDCILLAVALRLGIKSVASADKAFRGVAAYTLYEPSDLKS